MLKCWFTYIYILCLATACSNNKKEKDIPYSTIKSDQIDRFEPEYLADIPQINLSFNNFYQFNFENFIVNGSVDSANLKQGYWVIQDVKKKLLYQGSFINDLQEGWWEVLSDDTLICAGHYKQHKKQGYWRYLQLGPNKNSKFVNYLNDTLNGLAREYTADSILISSGNYAKGLKNGYWKYYYQNGVLKEQGHYHDNYKSGWWQSYDVNGKINQEASYSKDEVSGYFKKYQNGIIAEEGQQLNGKNWGVWKYYDLNGNLLKVEEFHDN